MSRKQAPPGFTEEQQLLVVLGIVLKRSGRYPEFNPQPPIDAYVEGWLKSEALKAGKEDVEEFLTSFSRDRDAILYGAEFMHDDHPVAYRVAPALAIVDGKAAYNLVDSLNGQERRDRLQSNLEGVTSRVRGARVEISKESIRALGEKFGIDVSEIIGAGPSVVSSKRPAKTR